VRRARSDEPPLICNNNQAGDNNDEEVLAYVDIHQGNANKTKIRADGG
jgi:hypothetical protein